MKIIYEDNHIIAVVKPAGVLTQGDHTGKISLFDEVKNYQKETKALKFQRNLALGRALNTLDAMEHKKPGNVFLGLVHRLDKPVSGIVLFAKTSKGASRLSEQFRNRTIQKTYHAVVVGSPKNKEGNLKEEVKKISIFAQGFSGKSNQEILKEIKKATKIRTAELHYKILKSNEKFSLLEVSPKTGRFHQIRIQMAEMGNPILGDEKYSKQKPLSDGSIALCATDLSFTTATTNERISLKIDLPEEWDDLLKS